jgi:hypothetical protein
MVDAASPTAPLLTDPSWDRADGCVCGAAEARTERHLRILEDLAEIGMDLARTVQRQAHEQAAAGSGAADLGLVFSRIARAVRQTVALEARLAEDRQTKTAAQIARQSHARATRRRRDVQVVVEQAIEADAADSDVEDLLLDLEERLVDYDDTDFSDRPVGELVARICRDLGVTPDWSLWDDEDWAIEETAARPRGSPYAAHDPDNPGSGDPGGDPPDKPPPKPPWRTH